MTIEINTYAEPSRHAQFVEAFLVYIIVIIFFNSLGYYIIRCNITDAYHPRMFHSRTSLSFIFLQRIWLIQANNLTC
jgi:hypothetical protein